MAILLKHKKHIITRLLPLVVGVILFAILPIIVEVVGRVIHKLITGTPCTQQNCITYGSTWFVMFTFSIAVLLFFALAIIATIDFILYKRKTNTNEK